MSGGAPNLNDAGIPMRIVYRKFIGPDGKEQFERYELPEIDARDACLRHKNEYSLSPWPSAANVADLVPPKLVVEAEMLPEEDYLRQENTPRTGFGGSHVIRKPVVLN
jgi:hypothetical protein